MLDIGKLAFVLLCGTAVAQQRTISARAGTINYQQGTVFVDDQRVRAVYASAHPFQMKNSQQLRIGDGRVELLLGLGVYLRMLGPGVIRMQETQLADTRVLIESGSALIEVAGMNKDAQLKVLCGEVATELKHDGFYRFDAPVDTTAGKLRIFSGDALITHDRVTVKERGGLAVALIGTLDASKFDVKESDALQTWSAQRSRRRMANERRRLEARAMQAAKRRAEMEVH